ncbi:neutral amino acid transporter [Apophysomyces sp. BC1034]|nr:neutral amino acid transporter [Apophysomyces sp. BC1021]KAG0185622.1 neutral amino acid transporter [Apophysomyces sp. BC1034]
MTSPLPVNAKRNYREEQEDDSSQAFQDGLSTSFDRATSTARLSSSPVPPNVRYGTSPKDSVSGLSSHSYGSADLDRVVTNASGSLLFRPLSTPTYNYDDNTLSVDLPEDQVAKVVKRHLVGTSSPAGSIGSSSSPKRSLHEDADDLSLGRVRSVHQLPGGAITHDIYKWTEGVENEQAARRQRSQSVHIPRQELSDPTLARLKDPGGFRRHFVVDKAAREGKRPPDWMTRTFVDFLALYGHFGGEDLSDSEDEEEDEEIARRRHLRQRRRRPSDEANVDEESPLIQRAQADAVQGTATPAKAVFLLLKSFVGTGQISLFVPLAMIRRIQKLSAFALIADLFILIGLVYLYYYDFWMLSTNGFGNVEWIINAKSFPTFIGTAVFSYEGVGLVIPITESMKHPKKFPRVLCGTMIFITLIFLSVGFVSYLAFGNKVQTVILLNMPPTPMVNTVQGLYALAICLSIPLQLFPAIRIIENALFTRSGKHNPVVKWQKNAFRFLAVLACSCIAIAGSGDLDKFVSLVGSLCCVPLCFLFPPLFHYKAIARTWRQKALDISILIFGIVSMTYTTGITIALWSQGGDGAPISRCTPSNGG